MKKRHQILPLVGFFFLSLISVFSSHASKYEAQVDISMKDINGSSFCNFGNINGTKGKVKFRASNVTDATLENFANITPNGSIPTITPKESSVDKAQEELQKQLEVYGQIKRDLNHKKGTLHPHLIGDTPLYPESFKVESISYNQSVSNKSVFFVSIPYQKCHKPIEIFFKNILYFVSLINRNNQGATYGGLKYLLMQRVEMTQQAQYTGLNVTWLNIKPEEDTHYTYVSLLLEKKKESAQKSGDEVDSKNILDKIVYLTVDDKYQLTMDCDKNCLVEFLYHIRNLKTNTNYAFVIKIKRSNAFIDFLINSKDQKVEILVPMEVNSTDTQTPEIPAELKKFLFNLIYDQNLEKKIAMIVCKGSSLKAQKEILKILDIADIPLDTKDDEKNNNNGSVNSGKTTRTKKSGHSSSSTSVQSNFSTTQIPQTGKEKIATLGAESKRLLAALVVLVNDQWENGSKPIQGLLLVCGAGLSVITLAKVVKTICYIFGL